MTELMIKNSISRKVTYNRFITYSKFVCTFARFCLASRLMINQFFIKQDIQVSKHDLHNRNLTKV